MEKPKSQSWLSKLARNRWFQAAYGLVGLGLAYVFIGWAIDTGSLLDYAIAFILLFIGIRELSVAIFNKRK